MSIDGNIISIILDKMFNTWETHARTFKWHLALSPCTCTYTYNESFGGQLISFGNIVIYVTNEKRKILRTDMPRNGGGGSDDNGTGGNNNWYFYRFFFFFSLISATISCRQVFLWSFSLFLFLLSFYVTLLDHLYR